MFQPGAGAALDREEIVLVFCCLLHYKSLLNLIQAAIESLHLKYRTFKKFTQLNKQKLKANCLFINIDQQNKRASIVSN